MRNVLCVQGGNSGTAYWRMFNWWVAAQRTRKAGWHVLGWEKEQNNCHPWQFDIADPANHPFLFGRLFTAGLEADAIVFQRCETKHALSAFYAMKALPLATDPGASRSCPRSMMTSSMWHPTTPPPRALSREAT